MCFEAGHVLISVEAVLEMVKRTAGGAVDADAPLMESGVDSLGAVELRNLLQKAAGEHVSLPSTVVFDHPTAQQLTNLVASSTDPSSRQEPIVRVPRESGQVAHAIERAPRREDVAEGQGAQRRVATGRPAINS